MKRNYHPFAQAIVLALCIVWAMLLLTSCGTSRRSNYQDHLRSTPTENWVRRDNGGCGWHN
jgi:hypothetical protein